MTDTWLNKWNKRFKNDAFAYGIEPNSYFKEQILKLKPGKILFGAEGEGRNAVYAATLGWEVFAFDISIEGKNKAIELANKKNVSIDYQIGQLPNLNFQKNDFDVVALIYAHFPPSIKSEYHKLLSQKLKSGGILILEAFGKNHLSYQHKNPKVGGPSNIDSLFSTDELRADFNNYEILELVEKEVELCEGIYHNGKGSVTRFFGRKG